MRSVEITWKAVVVRDQVEKQARRAVAGEIVTVSDHDASYLIGMGRAKDYVPPPAADELKAKPKKQKE